MDKKVVPKNACVVARGLWNRCVLATVPQMPLRSQLGTKAIAEPSYATECVHWRVPFVRRNTDKTTLLPLFWRAPGYWSEALNLSTFIQTSVLFYSIPLLRYRISCLHLQQYEWEVKFRFDVDRCRQPSSTTLPGCAYVSTKDHASARKSYTPSLFKVPPTLGIKKTGREMPASQACCFLLPL